MKNTIAPFPWKVYLLYQIFWLLNSIETTRLQIIRLEKVWQEIAIKKQYEFNIPEVGINCACRSNRDIVCETGNSPDSQNHPWTEQICVYCNVSTGGQCSIKIWPAAKEKYYTAYKIDHSNQLTFLSISYSNGNQYERINIPKGIHRIKVSDNTIVMLDTSHVCFDTLNAVNWFYGERNSSNIKCASEVNDVNEWSLTKLGWYRLNLANGKFEVDEKIVKGSILVDDTRCPIGDVKWNFKANHYYNRNGLLQSTLPGKSIYDVTGMIVDNVIINSKNRTISIEYKTNLRSIHFLPSSPSESFNFSALITVDRYENKMVHITVYEVYAQQVNAEIGIPGTTRSMISFYHEKGNQTHVYRVSATIIGTQWICAYPTQEYRRCTCVQAIYRDFSILDRKNGSNSFIYNPTDVHGKLAPLRNKTLLRLPYSDDDDDNNKSNVIIISTTCTLTIVIIAIVVIFVLRIKRTSQEHALINEIIN